MLYFKRFGGKFRLSMKPFDYIISGAGASGLTLAHLLLEHKNKHSILIIDKDDKTRNDRTWCFWQKGDNLYEEIVSHQWSEIQVKGSSFNETYDITPYQYKMVRGIDYYNFLKPQLLASSQVTWVKEDVQRIEPSGIVVTNKGTYRGRIVFNSTIDYQQLEFEKSNNILQHFKGWIIETDENVFNPNCATYMDFSVDQEADCRFGYVLPFTKNKALVEFTLFNKTLLEDEAYDARLHAYIKKLGINQFEILEEEKGVIPMTDFPFQIKESKHVFNIGILGGFAKASTGYSFLRAQKILKQMVLNIELNKEITSNLPHQKVRFKKYDATLLDILSNKKFTGEDLFVSLFEKNGAHVILKFLDEETSLAEELKIMSSTPILDFGKSFIKQLMK